MNRISAVSSTQSCPGRGRRADRRECGNTATIGAFVRRLWRAFLVRLYSYEGVPVPPDCWPTH
jgi:hypothetical protein